MAEAMGEGIKREKDAMKIIFLDRDGVINRDPGFGGYITSWKVFEFLPRSLEALKKLNQAGYEVFIISNQAGVAKGLYTLKDLDEINKNMLKEVEKAGGRIRSIHYCPHMDEDNCGCRKPKTGLFSLAAKDLGVNFADAFFVGDNRRDILAGKAIGCKTIFVLSGNTSLENLDVKPDFIARDLFEAVEKIVLKSMGREKWRP
jgi:D-glycero-D-manno-heptose 1,7-bisphosphate phosphatase